MDLAGGFPRLSWLYLGFFPLAYGCAYLWSLASAGFAGGLARLPGRAATAATRALPALPALLLALHVADQLQALRRQQPTLLSWLGVGASAVDEWPHRSALFVRRIHAADGGRGADAPLAAPPWLQDGDRVLILPDHSSHTSYSGKHALMKRAVFIREPYAEAFAYQQRGPAFLRDLAAYNDFQDGRVTERLLSWLRARDVSVILVTAEPRYRRFIEVLRERWPHPIERIPLVGFRLRQPVSESPP